MAANFQRAEIWSNLQCASGTKLDVFDPLTKCEESQQLDGNDSLVIEFAADDSAAAHVTTRRVIRLCFSDGSFTEYRIQEPESQFGRDGNKVTVKAVSVLFDLADATIITETQSSGVVDFDVGLFQVTVTEVVDDYIIAKLPSSYSYFARGTIDPTALYDVAFKKSTPLALLQSLAQTASDPTTRRPAEIQIRRNGTTGYYIDVLTEIGSSQAVADLRTQKNILRHTFNQNAQEQATVVFPFGADDANGRSTSIERVAWLLDNGSGTTFEITDPEGGPSPVLEDDQLNGMYVVPVGTGSPIQITDSAAGSPATVTLATASGITDGDVVELRADASSTLLTELSSPSAAAAPPTGYGRKIGTVDRPDILPVRNLAPNGWFSNWSVAGSAPPGWSYNSGAAGFSQNTDPLYTRYGGKSIYGTFQVSGSTIGELKSDAIYIRPVTGASQFSLKVALFLKTFTGQAQITLQFYNAIDPQSPQVIGTTQIIPTNFPVTSSATRVAAGDWFVMILNGADLTPYLTSGVKVRLLFEAYAGRIEVYTDAVMMVQSPEAGDQWVQYSTANALWHAANLALQFNKDPIASYQIDVVDRFQQDATAYPFEQLVKGGTIRDSVPEQGITNASLRITGITRNRLAKGDTSIEVATRRKLLSDLLASGGFSGGATVSIAGSGSAGTTTPPTPAPTPGPTPGAPPSTGGGGGSSGSAAPALPLLKTIWALGAGETTAIEDFPSADTEIDANDQFLVDLTQIQEASLTGKVVTAGFAGSELRLKYLRPSDSTWRALDGSTGPSLLLTATGRIQSASAAVLEPDARGQRWCSLYGINGNDAADPELGHLALHGGPVVIASGSGGGFAGDWPQLIQFLGGDSEVPFFYDGRYNVTVNAGDAEAIDDVRGVSGYGPQLSGGSSWWPAYDATEGTLQFRGTGGGRQTLESAAPIPGVDLSNPLTLLFIGRFVEFPTTAVRSYFAASLTYEVGGNYAYPANAFGIRMTPSAGSYTQKIAVESRVASGTPVTVESTVAPSATLVRVVAAVQDGTDLTQEVANALPSSTPLSAPYGSNDAYLWLAGLGNWDAFFGGDRYQCDILAVIGVKHALTPTEVDAVRAWAVAYRGATPV